MKPRDTEKKIPACVGVIIDGNRRWAKQKGLPSLEGHRQGSENLKRFLDWAREAGVKCVIAYCFSTENWNRAEEEVSYLMTLIRRLFENELARLKEKNVRVRILGDRSRMSEDIQNLFQNVEKETARFSEFTFAPAISYGGREEIVTAVNSILSAEPRKGHISKEEFSNYLWTAGIPDPDLIIRTSGEMRLSNFLSWQAAYSELFFPETLWPDFSKEDFLSILEEYKTRERRFGK